MAKHNNQIKEVRFAHSLLKALCASKRQYQLVIGNIEHTIHL